jgi:membrane fusion protein, copper/silver efflux system
MKRIIETCRTGWQRLVLAATVLLYGTRSRLPEASVNDTWRTPGMRCAAIGIAAALCTATLAYAACRWGHAERPNQSSAPAAAKPRKVAQLPDEDPAPASLPATPQPLKQAQLPLPLSEPVASDFIAEAPPPRKAKPKAKRKAQLTPPNSEPAAMPTVPDPEPQTAANLAAPNPEPVANLTAPDPEPQTAEPARKPVTRKTAVAKPAPAAIHARAMVTADERRVVVIAPKFDGWIEKLQANTTGQTVKRGQVLFETYVDKPGVERLRRAGKHPHTVALRSPISGSILEKTALRGMHFARGEALYRIADLSSVWVVADVPEKKVSAVKTGQAATVTFAAYPGRKFQATVAYVYPTADPHSHAIPVRLQLPNDAMLLKPGMRAKVDIVTTGGNDGKPKDADAPSSAPQAPQ